MSLSSSSMMDVTGVDGQQLLFLSEQYMKTMEEQKETYDQALKRMADHSLSYINRTLPDFTNQKVKSYFRNNEVLYEQYVPKPIQQIIFKINPKSVGTRNYIRILFQIITLNEHQVIYDHSPLFLEFIVLEVRQLNKNWKNITLDIRRGKLHKELDISYNERLEVNMILTPDPELSLKLDKIFKYVGLYNNKTHNVKSKNHIQMKPFSTPKPHLLPFMKNSIVTTANTNANTNTSDNSANNKIYNNGDMNNMKNTVTNNCALIPYSQQKKDSIKKYAGNQHNGFPSRLRSSINHHIDADRIIELMSHAYSDPGIYTHTQYPYIQQQQLQQQQQQLYAYNTTTTTTVEDTLSSLDRDDDDSDNNNNNNIDDDDDPESNLQEEKSSTLSYLLDRSILSETSPSHILYPPPNRLTPYPSHISHDPLYETRDTPSMSIYSDMDQSTTLYPRITLQSSTYNTTTSLQPVDNDNENNEHDNDNDDDGDISVCTSLVYPPSTTDTGISSLPIVHNREDNTSNICTTSLPIVHNREDHSVSGSNTSATISSIPSYTRELTFYHKYKHKVGYTKENERRSGRKHIQSSSSLQTDRGCSSSSSNHKDDKEDNTVDNASVDDEYTTDSYADDNNHILTYNNNEIQTAIKQYPITKTSVHYNTLKSTQVTRHTDFTDHALIQLSHPYTHQTLPVMNASSATSVKSEIVNRADIIHQRVPPLPRPDADLRVHQLAYDLRTKTKVKYSKLYKVGNQYICPFPLCGQAYHSKEVAFAHMKIHMNSYPLYRINPAVDQELQKYTPFHTSQWNT